VRPAGRGGDLVGLKLDAVLVADTIERRQHVRGELAGLLEHRCGNVGVEIAVMPGLEGRFEARAVVQRKQHVVDRGAVGHGSASGEGRGDPTAVFPRNRASLNSSDMEKASSGAVKRGVNSGEIRASSLLK